MCEQWSGADPRGDGGLVLREPLRRASLALRVVLERVVVGPGARGSELPRGLVTVAIEGVAVSPRSPARRSGLCPSLDLARLHGC